MGNYITNGDIYSYKLYGLTNTDIPSATMNAFILEAESIVDSKIGANYALPFSIVPPIVITITRDITAYIASEYLWQMGNRNTNRNIEARYTRSLTLLDDIRRGDSVLVTTAGVLISPDNDVDQQATYSSCPPIVDMDDFMNWNISESLDDIIEYRRSL